ncbi:MAG: Hpt domain-containing protein [Solirubrobacterales bacterium]
MSSSMDELIERFKGEARERYERIQTLLDGVGSSDDAADRCNGIREEAHKLKGAAGMLGFPELKDRASELEALSAAIAEQPDERAQATLTPAVSALASSLPATEPDPRSTGAPNAS